MENEAREYRLAKLEDTTIKPERNRCTLCRGRSIVILLYFALSVAPSGAAGLRWPECQRAVERDNGDHGAFFPKERYTLVLMGNGKASDGTDLDIRVYRSSNGTKITTAHGRFVSPKRANSELQHEIKQATRVIEKGSKNGRFGGVVGERAVLVLARKLSGSDSVEVVWTNGSHLYKITSSSLRLGVDMEKRYY